MDMDPPAPAPPAPHVLSKTIRVGRKKEIPRPEGEYFELIKKGPPHKKHAFTLEDCKATLRVMAVQERYGVRSLAAERKKQEEVAIGYHVPELKTLSRYYHKDRVSEFGLRYGDCQYDASERIIPMDNYWPISDRILDAQLDKSMKLSDLKTEASKQGRLNASLFDYLDPSTVPQEVARDEEATMVIPAPVTTVAPAAAPAPMVLTTQNASVVDRVLDHFQGLGGGNNFNIHVNTGSVTNDYSTDNSTHTTTHEATNGADPVLLEKLATIEEKVDHIKEEQNQGTQAILTTVHATAQKPARAPPATSPNLHSPVRQANLFAESPLRAEPDASPLRAEPEGSPLRAEPEASLGVLVGAEADEAWNRFFLNDLEEEFAPVEIGEKVSNEHIRFQDFKKQMEGEDMPKLLVDPTDAAYGTLVQTALTPGNNPFRHTVIFKQATRRDSGSFTYVNTSDIDDEVVDLDVFDACGDVFGFPNSYSVDVHVNDEEFVTFSVASEDVRSTVGALEYLLLHIVSAAEKVSVLKVTINGPDADGKFPELQMSSKSLRVLLAVPTITVAFFQFDISKEMQHGFTCAKAKIELVRCTLAEEGQGGNFLSSRGTKFSNAFESPISLKITSNKGMAELKDIIKAVEMGGRLAYLCLGGKIESFERLKDLKELYALSEKQPGMTLEFDDVYELEAQGIDFGSGKEQNLETKAVMEYIQDVNMEHYNSFTKPKDEPVAKVSIPVVQSSSSSEANSTSEPVAKVSTPVVQSSESNNSSKHVAKVSTPVLLSSELDNSDKPAAKAPSPAVQSSDAKSPPPVKKVSWEEWFPKINQEQEYCPKCKLVGENDQLIPCGRWKKKHLAYAEAHGYCHPAASGN